MLMVAQLVVAPFVPMKDCVTALSLSMDKPSMHNCINEKAHFSLVLNLNEPTSPLFIRKWCNVNRSSL